MNEFEVSSPLRASLGIPQWRYSGLSLASFESSNESSFTSPIRICLPKSSVISLVIAPARPMYSMPAISIRTPALLT
ncbi:hypothetical protein D3C75_1168110 [compost metagenome]